MLRAEGAQHDCLKLSGVSITFWVLPKILMLILASLPKSILHLFPATFHLFYGLR